MRAVAEIKKKMEDDNPEGLIIGNCLNMVLSPKSPADKAFLEKLSMAIADGRVELEQTLITSEEAGKPVIQRLSVRLVVPKDKKWRKSDLVSPCCPFES